MFSAKSIRYQCDEQMRLGFMNREIKDAVLALDVNDKNGVEYHDLDIVKVWFPIEGFWYPMLGVIRYFGGRFEIVCPWKARGGEKGAEGTLQRYVMGLNSKHEIVGTWALEEDRAAVIAQMESFFTKEGGRTLAQ